MAKSHDHRTCAGHVRADGYAKRLCVNLDRLADDGARSSVTIEAARADVLAFAAELALHAARAENRNSGRYQSIFGARYGRPYRAANQTATLPDALRASTLRQTAAGARV